MNKTKIEWVKNPDGTQGYTWNPITGCLNHINGLCKGGNFPCYAYKLAHGRLKKRYKANRMVADVLTLCDELMDRKYNDPFYPRLWTERLDEDLGICRGIFVCDMSDLFGNGIPEEWTMAVLDRIRRSSHRNRYYLLTKQPQNLIKWSPYPENCWIGVTVTNRKMLLEVQKAFNSPINSNGIRAKVKFISFEPLLEPIICKHEWEDTTPPHQFRSRTMPIFTCSKCRQGENWGDLNDEFIGADGKPIIQWLIIGQQTPISAKTQPKIEWIQEIVGAADKAGIPVFLKDNLRPLVGVQHNWAYELWFVNTGEAILRQEFPR